MTFPALSVVPTRAAPPIETMTFLLASGVPPVFRFAVTALVSPNVADAGVETMVKVVDACADPPRP